ncbi:MULTISPECIES: ribbon-helix-helix domain-containing protein [unclassified Bradyrhizobium]|uniref:ribbon-helix-helix domain-containing protein n=1 Tax=unclassified Bradyrhizobium TaxID=2631580 RepID=UPI0020B4506D|nr:MULTISPECIES: ribbon-helix-helix domain-containing protein [unclassified Bradyrhizobium]MCP3397759.1 ribbon-helix-helix domain-containing protein [Bradyrhizobium sp. CCGB20]MCP3406349.1 ribbon-helix-helix domain-containing protein [Bradyrhizobium sp. CCGB01]
MGQRSLTIRLQVELSKEELQAIDDFWFAERLPSRAAAVRELLRRGLTVQKCTANVDS